MKIKHFFSTFNNERKPIQPERKCEAINISPAIIAKAKKGDVTAQLELGIIYYNAAIVENHEAITFDWISRSAEQCNMEAQFRLGDLYALGFGTTKSLSDSYKWYTMAAIQGYKKALIRIHNLYQEDIRMHCRGILNSEEEKWASDDFKKENNIRELNEYRLEQNKPILNGAIEYYTNQFKSYQSLNQNDPNVQLNLAFLYQHGYGTKKCSRWAFEYYSLAAEQGNIDAQYNLGNLYQQHTRKKFNYRYAFEWYTKSAQGGNIFAQRCLAYFYLKGIATEIDYKMALSWYSKAAEAGDSQSQVTLGLLYRKGDYIERDLLMAVKWYKLAARQGNIVARNCLSQLHQRGMINKIELDEGIYEYITEESMNDRLYSKLSMDIFKLGDLPKYKHLKKLVKHALIGDGPAMYKIGLRYYHGYDEFPKDEDTGIKWIKNAANRGHKDAQSMIAKLYRNGDSIEQDYHKSTIWYKKIAKKKDADAQCQVGIMYKGGIGVRRDPLEASKWFIWSYNQENSDGQFNFGMLKFLGNGVREDKKEAIKWFHKSVFQKNAQACYKLGKIYFENNDNSNENLQMSLNLLGFAAKHDSVKAQLFLGNIYKSGYRVQRNISKSIEFYTKGARSGSSEAQYLLALLYLNGDGVNHDYRKAYVLFKQASISNQKYAKRLFQTPVQYDFNINDYSKVISMFTEVTEKGIDDLAYNIGFIYENGVEGCFYDITDISSVKKWYLIASKKGDSRADYRLGIMYEYGKGVYKNIVVSRSYYKDAVEKGNTDAMYTLACKYLDRYDVFKNLLEAFYLYTKASTMGHKEATAVLMILEHNDDIIYKPGNVDEYPGITIDRPKRIRMLEKATESGCAQLQYQLGYMYKRNKDYPNALKWLSLAAGIGVTDAYYMLGVIYEEGNGVKPDYTTASCMYQKASEKDHSDACFRLGHLYQYGRGIKIDYLRAYNFYKKAAEMDHIMAIKILNITQRIRTKSNGGIKENSFNPLSKKYQDSLTMCKYVAEHGDAEIQFKVGYAYEYSDWKPDYANALKWYFKAAGGSHKQAMYHLGLLYEKGLGVYEDYHEAIRYYSQASHLGNIDALYRLGIVYHRGNGLNIDPVKAVECYTLSAKQGNPKHQTKLGRLYEEGELVQRNLLEALKWYTKAYLQGYDDIRSKLYDMYEDKPYENFFFEKLFRNLSVASLNQFSLNKYYDYKYLGDINNRLGFMSYFGIGTDKNLKQSLQFFLKEYSDRTNTSITEFRLFEYGDFDFSQKIDILKEFTNDEECIDQFNPNELYTIGMVFYDGKIQSQYFNFDNEKKIYTPIDERSLKHTVINKDYSNAFNYMKRAANKKHSKALLTLGIMYFYGFGIHKSSDECSRCFSLASCGDIESVKRMAVLCHTHIDIKNFSKAFECYKHLEKAFDEGSSITEGNREETSELAQTGLGLLYEYGDGVKQDYQEALNYYKKAVDSNNRMGCLRLGLMYYYGKGVPIDYKKAFDLIEESSSGRFFEDAIPYVYAHNNLETSNDDSQRKLVYCTKTGRDIEGEIFYYRGLMKKHGQGTEKNEARAQFYFRWALDYKCQRAANEIKEY